MQSRRIIIVIRGADGALRQRGFGSHETLAADSRKEQGSSFIEWPAAASSPESGTRSVLGFAVAGHLHNSGVEPGDHLHQILLLGHDRINVLVDARHLVRAGGENVDSLL